MIHPLLSARIRPLAVASLLAAAATAQFSTGNLVVVRVGDGAAALTNGSTATFLDVFSTAGTPILPSMALPTVAAGANQAFSNSGTATSEGFLNLSTDGFYLTLSGYSASPGTPAIAATLSSATPRVIARVDRSGIIDTSTTLGLGYNMGNPRAAITTNGFDMWTSGTGASDGGVRYTTLGQAASTLINSATPSNTRVIGSYAGNLFISSASNAFHGISQVGSGLPTVFGATVALLNGFPSSAGPSSYDFFFATPSILYVADDRANGSGGIQKWEQLTPGTWTLQYTLQPTATSGCRGLTGRRFAGTTTLWATTTTNTLVSVDDTGAASAFNILATAASNTAFRGVRYIGPVSTLQRLPATCGAAGIDSSGTAEIGTDVVTTIQNPVGIPFVGYGLQPLAVPFCNCTVLHEFTLLFGGPQHVLSLPNQTSLIGASLRIQGLDFLAPGGCPDPLLTLTDGYSLTIQ